MITIIGTKEELNKMKELLLDYDGNVDCFWLLEERCPYQWCEDCIENGFNWRVKE